MDDNLLQIEKLINKLQTQIAKSEQDEKRIEEQLKIISALTNINEQMKKDRGVLLDYKTFCDNLYDGIHIASGDGTVLFINKAYTRTTGITPEEIVGRKVQDIESEGILYKGSVTGEILRTKQRINSVATIKRLGKEVLVTGNPILNKKGELLYVVTNTRDFYELKDMEQKLLKLTEDQNKANEELAYHRSRQAGTRTLSNACESMKSVSKLIKKVAGTDVNILITGESGTGKELVANEIYQNSNRNGKPFIKINCAAIPAELLESELFGYEGGSFTNALKQGKAGMFELANTGVILLDEIGDMPMQLQTKLLRVLQNREIRRIGGSESIKLDFQLIAATNKDLKAEIARGNFREDLYYRLNVVPIEIKPLRERKEDIIALSIEFCEIFNRKHQKQVRLSEEAALALTEYNWPGNIRELENLIERVVVTSLGDEISISDIVAILWGGINPVNNFNKVLDFKTKIREYEKQLIYQALSENGSIRQTAKALGIDHSTLVKKLQIYKSAE